MPKKIILIYIYIYFAPLYCNKLCISSCQKKKTMLIFFILKKIKYICFNDTNDVTNIISYNINSYLFEWHKNMIFLQRNLL